MSNQFDSTTVLTADRINDLLGLSNHQFSIDKGSFLFQEGMDAEEIFLVLSGKIVITKSTPEGREFSLRICSENDICGELILFLDDAKHMFSGKAMEKSTVAAISKHTIETEITKNNALAVDLLKWMTDNSRKIQLKFRDLILHGKKGALYSTLIRLSNSFGVNRSDGILIDCAVTNQELANFCGTSRESINRILNELKRNSIISSYKGKIIIHDIHYLRKEVYCEFCPIEFCRID